MAGCPGAQGRTCAVVVSTRASGPATIECCTGCTCWVLPDEIFDVSTCDKHCCVFTYISTDEVCVVFELERALSNLEGFTLFYPYYGILRINKQNVVE